jgi:tRNA pseudouridine55 synthase
MSRRRQSRWHGLLPVLKSSGPTSHDVVDIARKALHERRIGHTGTLDPMAEGLLLLCVGQATRLQRYLMNWPKTYEGEIRLGHATATYDREGDPMDPRGAVPDLDRGVLNRLEQRFTGTIRQVPPPYSAKKVAGKKLYELARGGQTMTVEPKTVTVHDLSLELTQQDVVKVRVTTSTGFYVRSLAHDVGVQIGCGAFLDQLRRVSIGPFTLVGALEQRALEEATDPADIIDGPAWIPLDRIALPFPSVDLNRGSAERFVHGQEVVVFRSQGEPVEADSEVAVRGPSARLLGIGQVQNVLARGRTIGLRPRVVLQANVETPGTRMDTGPTVATEETS